MSKAKKSTPPVAAPADAPLYQAIKHYLLQGVQSGVFGEGARVPSENELCLQFGVSRLTAQRAVRELVAEGVLRRVQGSGTFVRARGEQFSLIEVHDLVEEIRGRGHAPETEVLLQRRERASADIAAALELPEEAPVFHVLVLQRMDGLPLALEERYARPDIYPDFLEQDFSRLSVFQYLASRSSLEVIENVVRAVRPDAQVLRLLEVRDNEPCLRLERRNWWQGAVVTLTRITYAGERYALSSRYRASVAREAEI